MGTKSTKSLQSYDPAFDNVYPEHPKFIKPQHEVFKKKIDEDIMVTSLSINNAQEVIVWEEKLQKLTNIQQQYILLPKNYKFIRKSMCGSSGDIIIAYDNYPYILQQEIANRSPLSKHLQQQEMWYLLFTIISGSVQIYNCLQQKVGDIQPANIFINDNGQIKISSQYSWPCDTNNYSKTLQKHIKTYLSPQQMQNLGKKYALPYTNSQVSQSFSIGLTMLQAGLLIIDILTPLYSIGTIKNFNIENLIKIKQSFKHLKYFSEEKDTELTYSQQLMKTIQMMTEINPETRLSARQVYQWLKPHEIDIVNLKRIQPGSPPQVKSRKKRGGSRFSSQFKLYQEQTRPKSTNIHIQSKIAHKKILGRPSSISLNSKRKKSKQQKQIRIQPINTCKNQQKIEPTTKSSEHRQLFEKSSQLPHVSEFSYYNSRLHSPDGCQKQCHHVRYPSPPITFSHRESNQIPNKKYINSGTNEQLGHTYEQATQTTIQVTFTKSSTIAHHPISRPIQTAFIPNNIHQLHSIKKPQPEHHEILISEPQTPNWTKFRSRQKQAILKNQQCDNLTTFQIPQGNNESSLLINNKNRWTKLEDNKIYTNYK